MKISKLFHWLYAFLMLLPCAFIVTNMIYYGFNKYAVSQEYTKEQVIETPVYYESNNILTYPGDIRLGNVYKVEQIPFTRYGSGNAVIFNQIKYLDEYQDLFEYQDDTGVSVYQLAIQRVTGHYIILKGGSIVWNNQEQSFTFNIVPLALGPVISDSGSYSAEHTAFGRCIFKSEEQIIKNIETETYTETYTNGIADSLSEAVNRTFELSLFSWANNSFIAAPFASLFSLFGLPTDIVFVSMLAYWATMSIIYLCFDLIMYVPLLAHRWIDKAMLE